MIKLNFKFKNNSTIASTFKKNNKNNLKRKIAIYTTILLVFLLGFNLLLFEPDYLKPFNTKDDSKEVKYPIIANTKSAMLHVGIQDKTAKNKGIPPKISLPNNTFNSPFQDLLDKLPQLPTGNSFAPSLPPKTEEEKSIYDNKIAYTTHASITDKLKEGLNSKWELVTFSSLPKDSSITRFSTSYTLKTNGEILEKLELLTIARTTQLESIKTARDSLDALIEESDEVNILLENQNSIIYDLSGKKGYQIGKIIVDEQGIYILGYVNLTTNNMPAFIKNQWLEKFKNI